jgi:hypothetical protein
MAKKKKSNIKKVIKAVKAANKTTDKAIKKISKLWGYK